MKKKLITLGILGLFSLVLVSAGILIYFGQINQNVDVEQSITLDGIGCSGNVCTEEIGTVYSPDTRLSGLYVLTNNDPENSREVELKRTSCGDAGCSGITTTYYTPSMENIIKGADRLVVTQNDDGGWDWGTPDGNPATPAESPKNTIGVTAQGVLDAYVLTEEQSYLDTAINAYDYMVVLATADERMRGPDIPFLVELSEATGNSVYAGLAEERYQDALTEYGSGTATGFAEFVRGGRVGQGLPALVSWDINLYVQGALALDRYYSGQGYDTDADAMTEVIYEFMYTTFDFENTDEYAYGLALTGAIESFATTGLHTDKLESLTTGLVNGQDEKGCFADPQITAYAIMALLNVNEKVVMLEASECLITTQDGSGAWLESDGSEYTEVGSEAIQTMLLKNQLTSPVTISADGKLGFVIANDFMTAGTETYIITTKALPVE